MSLDTQDRLNSSALAATWKDPMFGVDRSHVAQGRGDPAGKAKPYSGPTDPVGWLATAARHALSHHHPESFAPHVVFPPYLLVKVCGPKRAVSYTHLTLPTILLV